MEEEERHSVSGSIVEVFLQFFRTKYGRRTLDLEGEHNSTQVNLNPNSEQ